MAVITSQTFDDNGIQFEYTQSRHRPDYFLFQDVATRRDPRKTLTLSQSALQYQ